VKSKNGKIISCLYIYIFLVLEKKYHLFFLLKKIKITSPHFHIGFGFTWQFWFATFKNVRQIPKTYHQNTHEIPFEMLELTLCK
jgi:hypothetical protein